MARVYQNLCYFMKYLILYSMDRIPQILVTPVSISTAQLSGGSGISRTGRGRQPQRGVRQFIILAIFPQNLHGIKNGPKGVPSGSLGSVNTIVDKRSARIDEFTDKSRCEAYVTLQMKEEYLEYSLWFPVLCLRQRSFTKTFADESQSGLFSVRVVKELQHIVHDSVVIIVLIFFVKLRLRSSSGCRGKSGV